MSTLVCEGKEYTSKAESMDDSHEKIKPEMLQTAERVRELYASGVPFFTKVAIADLVHQIDSARKHHHGKEDASEGEAPVQMLSLQGLDGKTVQIEIRVGTAGPEGKSGEQVLAQPGINYRTYQHLITGIMEPRSFSLKLAYCPLRVYYDPRKRDKTTNQFLEEPRRLHFEAAQEAFNSGVNAWEGTEECKRLTSVLLASTLPDKITKVIAFACCTVSSREDNSNRIIQHALVLTIKKILQKRSLTADVNIECYAQDPVYTDVDRAVLEGAGIRILEDPHAFLEVDDSSVVISFSPNVPVRQLVADVARPAILLWNRVKPEEEMPKYWSDWWQERNFETVEELEGAICDPESSRLREMIHNEYIEVQQLSYGAFNDSCVYVRRC